MNPMLDRIEISLPILQSPMAGVSTPEMAAAVSEAGGLGALGLGNLDAAAARRMMAATRKLTDRPVNVNLFCHPPASADPAREGAWSSRLAPLFAEFGAAPPAQLSEIYRSFQVDDEMLAALLEERPAVVSFHFGLPPNERIAALRSSGTVLLATATNLREARAIEAAGIDAVVAQGSEAGGHSGVFEPAATDERLGTLALTRLLVRQLSIPVIAAGGIMDGAGIAASLALGASAAQLGTAFLLCPESAADAGYRATLASGPDHGTVVTSAFSGRPARSLVNRFTTATQNAPLAEIPDYPIAYDLAKSLHAAARAKGEYGFGAQWAGQGFPMWRALTAGELVRVLQAELEAALLTLRSPPGH